MIVKSESRINRSNQISQQALELANKQIEEEKDFPSKPGIANYFFESPEAQEKAAKQAEQDLDFLEAEIKEKSSQYNAISEQYADVNSRLTDVNKELQKEEYKDPKAYIEKIKAKYDLTTQEGVEAANKEIQEFIGKYSNLIEEYNTLRPAVQDTANALIRLEEEISDLGVREQDLNAFTNTISKNHRTATKIALAFGNATVDLVQGAADFVYMVNPLGAIADELVDYAGEDSLLGTIVEDTLHLYLLVE